MAKTAFYEEMVARNIGVLSAEEQERLRKSCVAVAGCGGMGGLSAEQLVRLGVGHVKIADHDTFAVHNLSRQCGSTSLNVGQNKADVLARHFKAINPELQLEVYTEGVVPENAQMFLDKAQVAIDGTDYSRFSSTNLMYKIARQKKICVVNPNAIGYGANVFVFGPKTISLEDFLGLSTGIDLKMALLRLVPYVPSYADPELVQRAALGEINIPNIIIAQHLGTSIAVTEAILLILGKVKEPAGPDPRVFIVDILERKFEITG